jgi:AraC-like DNA-binding protein
MVDRVDHFTRQSFENIESHAYGLATNWVQKEAAISRSHFHDFFELAYVDGGTGTYKDSNGDELQLSAGQVFLLRPGEIHAYNQQQGLSVRNVMWLSPDCTFDVSDLSKSAGYRALFELEPKTRGQLGLTRCLVLDWHQRQEFTGLLDQFAKEMRHDWAGQHTMLNCIFGLMLGKLCLYYEGMSQERGGELLPLAKALAWINEHLDEPLEVDKLLELSCMSRASFYRHFTQAMGMSPAQYALKARLQQGRKLLTETRRSVTDIALDCGFCDGSRFGMYFQREFHQTPRQYRQAAEGQGEIH